MPAHFETRLRPIIRLFVSSTFSDLKQERDALQQRVFPVLEQLCLKAGFQFQAIDLRWGVSKEAGLDHRTMRICFEELQRSQEISPEPNFLILLGNRYGWRPLPEEISADEFHALEVATGRIVITPNQPSPIDVLKRWYQRDENALKPTYVFMARTKPDADDPDRQDYTEAAVWQRVEQVLWQIINRAYPPELLSNRFKHAFAPGDSLPSLVHFQTSATEQEIWCGALCVTNASQHVLAFFRELEPSSVADKNLLKDYYDLVDGEMDALAQSAQQDLKTAIKLRLGDNARTLPPAHLIANPEKPDAPIFSVSTDHIDELCREVQDRLTGLIEQQIQTYWRDTRTAHTNGDAAPSAERTARELEIERDEHGRFGRERGATNSFVGRQDQLLRMLAYVDSDSRWPLVVHGASGCGKTALLARAVAEFPVAKQPVVRYIGVTPRSSDLRSLLRTLCQELRLKNSIEGVLPADVRELIEEFRKHLQAATAEQPVILFLDALDQLAEADNARQLFWIPFGPLPAHVKLVVSCLSDRGENDPSGQPYVALQRRKFPAENVVNLDALSFNDAQTLLFERWLPDAGRQLNAAQTRLIEQRLASEPCRQPLFLKLLFEEVKLWRSWDQPVPPGGRVPALLEQLCARLSHATHHGHSLVKFVLGYLAAARRGLSETELLAVLFADPDYKRELDDISRRNQHVLPAEPPRIPIALWSRLRSDLAPYLAERSAPGGSVWTLYHRQVAEWVHARYVDEADWNPHSRLADFFSTLDYFLESLDDQRARARRFPPSPRPVNIRKVDELPHQLLEVARRFGKDDAQSPHWNAIANFVTDLHFLEAKAEAKE